MVASNITVTHSDTGLLTAEVSRAERISPHFVRLTFAGDGLREWNDLGFDQWFRLALPLSDGTRFDRLSERFDTLGYLRYLTLPKATRPMIRNYTVREARPEIGELDVDFVMRGADGVAGPWAEGLPVGAPVALIDQGSGYRPVEGANRVLLAGDESALPAVAGILRDLPRETSGHTIIEIPHDEDRQPLDPPAGVAVQWIVRETGQRPGAAALAALRALPKADGEEEPFLHSSRASSTSRPAGVGTSSASAVCRRPRSTSAGTGGSAEGADLWCGSRLGP